MPRDDMKRIDWSWLSGFAQFVAFCFVIAACVVALRVLPGEWLGWRYVGVNFAIGYLYAFLIGGVAMLVVPLVARRVWHRAPFTRWSVLLATLAAIGVAGTFLGAIVLQLFGFGSVTAVFQRSLWIGVPVTLIVGVLVTIFESSRERLQATELALRTHQLERERAEKLAAEARLAVLTSRVQPHFLFNTLNSIAELVRQDPRQAEETIERLSGLLRSSLDPADAVPLERELKLVADYLHIQQTRLGRRLRFTIDSPPDSVGGTTVPPFAVQTLVENAVKHVGGQRGTGVEIHVRAARTGSDLLIEVTDDGPGFGHESIRPGHGLDNLQARLHSLYGQSARLDFARTDRTMTVRLVMPA